MMHFNLERHIAARETQPICYTQPVREIVTAMSIAEHVALRTPFSMTTSTVLCSLINRNPLSCLMISKYTKI